MQLSGKEDISPLKVYIINIETPIHKPNTVRAYSLMDLSGGKWVEIEGHCEWKESFGQENQTMNQYL